MWLELGTASSVAERLEALCLAFAHVRIFGVLSPEDLHCTT